MDPAAEKIILNGAPSQYQRWLRALAPGYVQVDERAFPELLDFAIEFGNLIYFYNLHDQIDGDWVDFFLTDPTMLLASMQATDRTAIEATYTRIVRRTRASVRFEPKFDRFRHIFQIVAGLARQINQWLKALAFVPETEVARLLRQDLEGSIEDGLGAHLRTLKSYDEGAAKRRALDQPIGLDYTGFLPIWNLNDVAPDAAIYEVAGRKTARIDAALPFVQPLFYAFLDALNELKETTPPLFSASLQDPHHKPQIALYIAFSRLFQRAQHTINTFTQRYARFYYRDVLRETPRPGIPDSLYLSFTLAEDEDVRSTTVPAGTRFLAGQDANGEDLLYRSDKAALVTRALLTRLHTLRVMRGPLYSTLSSPPEMSPPDDPPRVVQRLLASEIIPPDDPTASAADDHAGWSTFGPKTAGTTASEVTTPATLGFALASPYLALSGGTRTITLSVRFPEAYARTVLRPRLDALKAATGLPGPVLFRTVLDHAFALSLSSADGWFPVETYQTHYSAVARAVVYPAPTGFAADAPDEAPQFKLRFSLPASAPAVAAYTPEEEASEAETQPDEAAEEPIANPAPDVPTLKVYLRPEPVTLSGPTGVVRVYPLSLLEGMPVQALRLYTVVKDLANLTLENTDGEVDTSAPFPLFGALPVVGAYLLIRNTELFVKSLDRLQIRLSWFNLPQNDDGFKGYYADYVIGPDGTVVPDLFNNQVFLTQIAVQEPGFWTLQPATDPCPEQGASPPVASPPDDENYSLFRTLAAADRCAPSPPAPAGPLCAETLFDGLNVCPTASPPAYYDPAQSALRLALTAPAYGFGSDLYARNVLNAVIKDLPTPEVCQAKAEARCKPYTEQADCLAAGLMACANLTGEAYHDGLMTWLAQCQLTTDPCVGACLDDAEPILHEIQCIQAALPGRGWLWNVILSGIGLALLVAGALMGVDPRWIPLVGVLVLVLWSLGYVQYLRFRKKLTVCSAAGTEEGAPCLAACLDEPTGLRRLLWLILWFFTWPVALVQLKSCATACKEQQDEVYKTTLSACLYRCRDQLEQLYSDCFAAALAECIKERDELNLNYPNDPYLPQLQALTLNYTAHTSLPAPDQSGTLFFHLLPFGGYRRVPLSDANTPPLLPIPAQSGNLYIGFSGLLPPQSLTLLFQMAAPAEGERFARPPSVSWASLSGNRWTRLTASQVLADTTDGLQHTGIVTLNLPAYDPDDHTILPPGFQWLRASVPRGAGRFVKTLGVYPHAVLATWQDNDNAAGHLAQPLPAGIITTSAEDLPDIASIYQPMASFGGRPAESRRTFERQLGERLRHKDRAILGWDYERLVLENFPTVWRVQALPTRTPTSGAVPGAMLVVIVPGPDAPEATDPTAPMASSALLNRIGTTLQERASPFVRLSVVNPVYVRIQVRATVAFGAGSDAGALVDQLNDDLVQYLSPWFYNAARAACGASYVSEGDIAEFIQTRPYVEALVEIDCAYAPSPPTLASDWYFLTSARQHAITDADPLPFDQSGSY